MNSLYTHSIISGGGLLHALYSIIFIFSRAPHLHTLALTAVPGRLLRTPTGFFLN